MGSRSLLVLEKLSIDTKERHSLFSPSTSPAAPTQAAPDGVNSSLSRFGATNMDHLTPLFEELSIDAKEQRGCPSRGTSKRASNGCIQRYTGLATPFMTANGNNHSNNTNKINIGNLLCRFGALNMEHRPTLVLEKLSIETRERRSLSFQKNVYEHRPHQRKPKREARPAPEPRRSPEPRAEINDVKEELTRVKALTVSAFGEGSCVWVCMEGSYVWVSGEDSHAWV
jgi:hypothetical protein